MTRQRIAAGNWKLHTTVTEGCDLTKAIVQGWQGANAKVIVGPPFTHLAEVVEICSGSSVQVAAQNCFYKNEGAYTGEVSPRILTQLGVQYVILGHSERRQYFNESNSDILQKLHAALGEGMQPILCCGEPLEIRERSTHEAHVRRQLEESVFQLPEKDFGRIVVAYEPIWAIGTGKTATPEQAQEMHAYIRNLIRQNLGEGTANDTSILYGGSVKPANAADLFAQADVDGGLIGGASLKAESFLEIANTLNSI
jgi:triosephosphate isomerase